MPDAVMMLAYPAAKPLDAKGYISRIYTSQDVLTIFKPYVIINVIATETAAATTRGV